MTRIFVFGSNLAGIHGGGAAKVALERYGAQWGSGVGRSGDSYAIPTKDQTLSSLRLSHVNQYIKLFIKYAQLHPELEFQVTQVGCGLAGFTAQEIAPLFVGAPDNCLFDESWIPFLGKTVRYWGSFDNKPIRKRR